MTPAAEDQAITARRVRTMLEQARALNDADRPQRALTMAASALRYLAKVADPAEPEARELQAQLLRVRSYSEGRLGDIDLALELLDQALDVDPRQEMEIAGAKAVLLLNVGRFADAVAAFDMALPSLTVTDPRSRIAALANRGVANLSLGRLAQAKADTEEAAELARTLVPSWQGGIRHNLGYIQFLGGDLTGALTSMAEAAELLPPSAQGVPALDRSKVLLAAGLVTEAGESAAAAELIFTDNKAVHDLAATLLTAADIALLADDPARGRELARSSAAISRRRSNVVNTLLAELAQSRAEAMIKHQRDRPSAARVSGADASAAMDLAARFASADLPEQEAMCRLIAADAYLDADDPAAARAAAGLDPDPEMPAADQQVPPGIVIAEESFGAIAMSSRLHRRLVAGRIELTGNRVDSALSHIAHGLDDLAKFQARFGSQDLQAAASIHGRNLARLGLSTAVATQDPALILEWLDRSRAVSTRLPVLRPSADPELAADLGALRVASAASLTARIAGNVDSVADAQVRTLRRKVRERSWTAAAAGDVERPASLPEASAAMGVNKATLLAVFGSGDRLHTVSVTSAGARYRDLGPLAPILAAERRVAADLDVLAMSRTPAAIRLVATTSLQEQLSGLQRTVFDEDLLGSAEEVIIAAGGEDATLPWGLLPGLRGRSVRVSASVSAAVRSTSAQRRLTPEARVVAVQGPDVPRGEDEIESVLSRYSNGLALTGGQAIGESVIGALADSPVDILHIAAHGVHEPDNPQFSGVLLVDGPLFAYDFAPLADLPSQVVLSSCDVGRSTDRPGGEPLGLTAALLRFGVPTVIAGTARVADHLAAEVMADYHRRQLAGASPAKALAAAVAAVDGPVPLTCFSG